VVLHTNVRPCHDYIATELLREHSQHSCIPPRKHVSLGWKTAFLRQLAETPRMTQRAVRFTSCTMWPFVTLEGPVRLQAPIPEWSHLSLLMAAKTVLLWAACCMVCTAVLQAPTLLAQTECDLVGSPELSGSAAHVVCIMVCCNMDSKPDWDDLQARLTRQLACQTSGPAACLHCKRLRCCHCAALWLMFPPVAVARRLVKERKQHGKREPYGPELSARTRSQS
jgi:hypothetical protein